MRSTGSCRSLSSARALPPLLQLLAQLLEQTGHQFDRVALFAAELGCGRAGGLAHVELGQQFLAQPRRTAQLAAGVVGDLGQMLLQGAQGGLQFVLAGGPPAGLATAALAGALLGQQVAQRLQHRDGVAAAAFFGSAGSLGGGRFGRRGVVRARVGRAW